MKITRYRRVQKYLKFYYNNFGFREPYQVMIDGTFCFAAFKEHINIREQLPKYLNAQTKLLTTRCIVIETEKIAKKTLGALNIVKQFGIHECGHKEPISGSNCILSMIGKNNSNHYILASQDRDLQEKLRTKPGVPLLYLHMKAPTLEKPSKASYDKAGQSIETNPFVFISKSQNEALKEMKSALGIEEKKEPEPVIIKKKKPHNPNPLSCKKKKPKQKNSHNKKDSEVVKEGKIKKRKKKLPQHIREQLQNSVVSS